MKFWDLIVPLISLPISSELDGRMTPYAEDQMVLLNLKLLALGAASFKFSTTPTCMTSEK